MALAAHEICAGDIWAKDNLIFAKAARLAIGIAGAIIVYFVSCHIMKLEELKTFKEIFNKKKRKVS